MNTKKVTIQTPAKINLYLAVLGKREDGFHELETLMTGVSIYDRLEVRMGGKEITFTTNRPFGPPENDLCYKAAALFYEHAAIEEGVSINLTKGIPDGAGLGGGSSDAAAVLCALEYLCGPASLSNDDLAAQLGSDVNFFLKGGSSWCYGRGEKIEKLCKAPTLWAVIIYPQIHIPTPAVFKQFALTDTPAKAKLKDCEKDDFLSKALFSNDLEQAACVHNKELQRCQTRLQHLCPHNHVVLSGSGSSFFITATDKEEAQHIQTVIEKEVREWPVFLVETNKQMIYSND